MQNKIIDMIKSKGKALSYEELHEELNLLTIEETDEYGKILDKLVKDGELYLSNKNRYMLFNDGPLKKGSLTVNKKGFGFVSVENQEEDIFVGEANLNGALDEDIVVVEVIESKADGRQEGRIVRVIKRGISTFVGEFQTKKNKTYVMPDDNSLKIIVQIDKQDSKNAVDGHKVVCKINKKIGAGRYIGTIEKIIGHKNDPGVDILSIVYKYEIKSEFDEETLTSLSGIPAEVLEEDRAGRRDLTGELIFTIDGDDTKDIDDALSIKKLENGNYELGVHIADVSYYVKEGEPLDKEAMERGTSVYLVDRVIPMLPHELSNGICSLNPNVDRLAISCVMEIDSKGQTKNYEIFPSIIKSRIQMTYKNVNKIIEQGEKVEGYEAYEETLHMMDELSKIIRDSKNLRGYIDFGNNEAKILVNEEGLPYDVVLRDRGRGENIIEDFMIQANECVASHIFYMDLPFIYRVHEKPKEEKMREFLSFLSSLGYNVTADMKNISPKGVQSLVNYLKDKTEFKVLSSLVLRNMQKAIYLAQNLGHYGLASKCYTHFTSPIRRYPDTTVHRLLRTYLFDNDMSGKTIGHWSEKLNIVAEHSSNRERASIDCEREVDSMKMAEYMESHIGEEYEAMVSGVANFGMFVQLDNLIEGLVSTAEMKDYFIYDETKQTLTGEHSKKVYRLGDRLRVKVVRASKEEKKIDFSIVEVSDGKKKDKKNI